MKKQKIKLKLKKCINFFFELLKYFFIWFLFFFSNKLILYAQWEQCNNGIIRKDAVWCFAKDGNNTYTGISGGVFMTTDYGNNWIAKNNGFKTIINEILISSLLIRENNIFAGTGIDGIFLSSDEGDNWTRKNNGIPYYVFNESDTLFQESIDAFIIIGNNIFAGTNKGIFVSSDNGGNWVTKNKGLPQVVIDIPPSKDTAINIESLTNIENNILAGTWYGVYMSTDNGENWIAKNNGMENLIILSLATSGDNIYAGTEFGGLFLSNDQGDNWENIGFNNTIISAIIIKGNNIIAGTNQGVYLSTDNGNNWTAKNLGLTHLGVISMIINGDYIFAGIDNYGIYRAKLSDLGITDVKEQEQTNEIKIFPNPASDEFRLRFHAPTETTVQLSVFDLLGNCVLSQKLQSTEGTNEKTINCEKLPQGYYYVKININEVVETVPLVIIK